MSPIDNQFDCLSSSCQCVLRSQDSDYQSSEETHTTVTANDLWAVDSYTHNMGFNDNCLTVFYYFIINLNALSRTLIH